MAYLISNIPYFKVWVRKEFTHNHRKYQGEYIHALACSITSIPDRCLSFQVIFTGCEDEKNRLENPHGGAMWARMPITALVADEPLDTYPPPIQTHLAQPWDCSARNFEVINLIEHHQVRGFAKLMVSFIQVNIYLLLITQVQKLQMIQHNTSNHMLYD